MSKTAVIVVIYYLSYLITNYNKFKGIAKDYEDSNAFWRVLVWIAWILYPIICPVIVALYVILQMCMAIAFLVEDAENSHKYSVKIKRNKGKYYRD